MREKSKRSWLSVSLRTLLLLMLASSCVLGLIGREVRQAQRREQAARDLSRTTSNTQIEYCSFWGGKVAEPPPAWQRKILGEHYFQRITAITIENPDQLPADGRPLRELKHLRSFIYVSYWPKMTDRQISGLAPLRQLESVTLVGAPLTDAALEYLSPENPLTFLRLTQTCITDAGLAYLSQFEKLESLDLSHTLITDEGLKHLINLPRLRHLRLCRVQVSDEGLETLVQFPALESLDLDDLPITEKGALSLGRMPHMKQLSIGNVVLSPSTFEGPQAKTAWRDVLKWMGPPDVIWALDRQHAPRNMPYLRWLLERGADPNSPPTGMRPVSVLAARNAQAPIELLLEFGADLNPTHCMRAPLTAAAERGHLEMMKFLLARGAKTETEGTLSPLMAAAYVNYAPAVELLLKHGADVNRADPDLEGATPLHAAGSNAEIVRLLLEAGANPNLADRRGNTPLHLVAQAGHLEPARLLLAHGADPLLQNAQGNTPRNLVHPAAPNGIVELLQRYEAVKKPG